ncbi:hemerythrin domain-containing protein [Cytobacillus sp. Hz8]|uniref:hemerythrin domain-containing protein n=1 Tax=Cytobacillus sp. Hz8 TaxID=3347168 RepID=UPI0035DFFD12
MSGPSLKKQDAHTSIHEAALNEAKDLNQLFKTCLEKDEMDRAMQVAEIILEHWESRTLKHAEAEEEGLYQEMVSEKPKLEKTVHQLTRDHDLMRRIVSQVKESFEKKKADYEVLSLMEALIIIDEIHNEDEMNKLLANNES